MQTHGLWPWQNARRSRQQWGHHSAADSPSCKVKPPWVWSSGSGSDQQFCQKAHGWPSDRGLQKKTDTTEIVYLSTWWRWIKIRAGKTTAWVCLLGKTVTAGHWRKCYDTRGIRRQKQGLVLLFPSYGGMLICCCFYLWWFCWTDWKWFPLLVLLLMARCVNIAVDIVEKKNIFIIILRIFCTLLLNSK